MKSARAGGLGEEEGEGKRQHGHDENASSQQHRRVSRAPNGDDRAVLDGAEPPWSRS